jgi:hypothetical protein
MTKERSELLDLKRQAQLTRVLELLVSGEASTISAACEKAGVTRNMVYRALGDGVLDEQIARLKHQCSQEVATILSSELPEILQERIKEAKGEGSLRDKDSITRTLLLYWQKVARGVLDEPPSHEDARAWLRGRNFSPIQVNVNVEGKEPMTTTIEVLGEDMTEEQ